MTEEQPDFSRRRFLKRGAAVILAAAADKAFGQSKPPVFNIADEAFAIREGAGIDNTGTMLTAKESDAFSKIADLYNNLKPGSDPHSSDRMKAANAILKLNARPLRQTTSATTDEPERYTAEEAAKITGRLIYEGAKWGPQKGTSLIEDAASLSKAGHNMEFIVTRGSSVSIKLEELLKKGLGVGGSVTAENDLGIPSWGKDTDIDRLKSVITQQMTKAGAMQGVGA